MENPRRYGSAPFQAALIHGGPGAAGEMAPVARVLAGEFSVLEPLQTAASLEGQVAELRSILKRDAGGPLALAGFSWGAWLAFILAARHPELVKKLILIGSGPFQEKYAHTISEVRFARLSAVERAEAGKLVKQVEEPSAPEKAGVFERLAKLLARTDAYDPEPEAGSGAGSVTLDAYIFRNVWREASEFRRSGGLLACAGLIKCPVTVLHGEQDPHPAEGVRLPLEAVIRDLNFILLRNCGHKPWVEKAAKEEFYSALKKELS